MPLALARNCGHVSLFKYLNYSVSAPLLNGVSEQRNDVATHEDRFTCRHDPVGCLCEPLTILYSAHATFTSAELEFSLGAFLLLRRAGHSVHYAMKRI